jgi:hypothetical protein
MRREVVCRRGILRIGITAVMADLHCRPVKRIQTPNYTGNHRGLTDLPRLPAHHHQIHLLPHTLLAMEASIEEPCKRVNEIEYNGGGRKEG